jgi:hypothetical protein
VCPIDIIVWNKFLLINVLVEHLRKKIPLTINFLKKTLFWIIARYALKKIVPHI